MKIHDARSLADLQKEFSNAFPYLKIEFFNSPHLNGMGSDESDILDSKLTIGEVRKDDTSGVIPLDGKLPVGVFEKLLEEKFGLFIQVYRISHGKWLQTWVTDVWTLEEQNNRGKIMGNRDNLLAN